MRKTLPMAVCLAAVLGAGWLGYRRVNAQMYHGPMRYAIFNRDHARLQALLDKGALPHGPAPGEEELLYLAVVWRNTAAVRSLLKRGAHANGRHGGRSILEHALQPDSDPELIRLLLDHGADVNETVRTTAGRPGSQTSGERALLTSGPMPPILPVIVSQAVQARNPEILKLVLDRGARVGGVLGDGPLVTAINGDAGEAVRLLVARGANPNTRLRGAPLLVRACGSNREKAGLALIEMKADVNAAGPDGRTPLMATIPCGGAGLARALLEHGARTDLCDGAGLNVLDHAERELKQQTDAINLHLRRPAGPRKVSPAVRESQLRWARLDARREIVRLLREARSCP